MNIAILSRGEALYSTQRLKEACLARGHHVDVLNPLKFSIHIERQRPSLYYAEKPVQKYDGVIPRIGASITFFGTAVVNQFEQMGVFCLNSSQAIRISRDKLWAVQVLSRHRVGIPTTEFVRQDVLQAIDRVGGAPVIIKVLEGTQGLGVILADSPQIAESIVETLQSAKQNVLIQKFVAESKGKDIRAFVIGGKVVAAMRRVAKAGEYRSNVHRGGKAERVLLDAIYEQAAVQAAQILNLNVAGVDMLESKQGPLIMEVNSSPGLEGIEEASGLDIGQEVVKYLEARVLFPDIDLRQRLTLNSGYGVAEVSIGQDSPVANKRVKDTGLREKDILILNITRESVVIPNPKGEREILAGDILLCFGKLSALKTLLLPEERPF